MNWELFLEYIKVIIWPILIVYVLRSYKKEIEGFFSRLFKVKFPGGELEAAQIFRNQIADKENEILAEESVKDQPQLLDEIKKGLEKNNNLLDRTEEFIAELLDELAAKELQLEFEQIYNKIFGSQIQLLTLLLTKTEGGHRTFVEGYYDSIKSQNKIFVDWHVRDYLSYLISRELIEADVHKSVYTITKKGVAFLSYITDLDYPKNKPL